MLTEILSKVSKIESAMTALSNLKQVHDKLITSNDKLFKDILSMYSSFGKSSDNKIEILSKLIDSKSSKARLVFDDFYSEANVISNNNFILIPNKNSFKLAAESVDTFSSDNIYYSGYISEHRCYCLYSFDSPKTFNNLVTSFYDGISFILPDSIKYISNGIEYDLLENFERFFDRKLEIENTYYFYPKTAEALKFYFNCSSSSLQVKKVSSSLETYPSKASLIFKYDNTSDDENLVFTHNFHDKYLSLRYFYYSENAYKEFSFDNHKAVFKNPKSKELLVKIDYDSSNIATDVSSVLNTETTSLSPSSDLALYSCELSGKFEKVVTDDTFYITISLASYKAIKEYLPDFAKFNNDELVVSSSFIRILGVNDTLPENLIDNLSDLNDVSLLEIYKKELFIYSPNTGTLYFANFLNKDSLKFTIHYQKEIYQDVSGINNYSPFLFDMTIV